MRIVSKFKDYYDSVQQFGQDDIQYIRETKEIEDKELYCGEYYRFIGFCGKIYPALTFTEDEYPYKRIVCHTIDDMDKRAESWSKQKKEIYYNDRKGKYRWRSGWKRKELVEFFNGTWVDKWNEKINKSNKLLGGLFEKYQTPIFIVSPKPSHYNITIVTLNPRLKDWEFYRIKPPYEAFQELQMYLANIAKPIKEIPKIPDKTMVEIKGFDKFSFRKEPSKKQ